MSDLPNQHGEGFDLTTWIAGRLDRLEATVEGRIKEVLEDAKLTRHTSRGTIGTMANQLAVLVRDSGANGVLVNEHDDRIGKIEGWQNRVIGAVAVLLVLFPITIGAVVAITTQH